MSEAITFESLKISKPILTALTNCGYVTPTQIQQQAIPIAFTGQDIIAKAPTGTGKTAAFILPALERLLVAKSRAKPRILVLTPTRELANQITDVIYKYGKELRVNPVSILGGMPYGAQLRKLARPSDILVATPGRLIDYMERGNMDFSEIEMLVLDEADRMLDMGFINDVEYIANAIPENRQTMLFTATMDSKLIKLAQRILKSPQHIEVATKKVTLDKISQRVYVADDGTHKNRVLYNLLANENVFKAIIFTATKRKADQLARQLTADGHYATALHGDMSQGKRNKTIADLRDGRIQILVATDVVARGLDINDISHVINYDLPKLAEDYVHRIGRTGRAERSGEAWSLVAAVDNPNLQRIERFTNQQIPRAVVEGLEPKKASTEAAGRPASVRKRSWSSRNRRGGGGGGNGGNGGGRGRR